MHMHVMTDAFGYVSENKQTTVNSNATKTYSMVLSFCEN